MMTTRGTGVAIYTSDRTAFNSLGAVLFPDDRGRDNAAASSMFKAQVMTDARLIAVDFTDFSDLSPLSVLFGALRMAIENDDLVVCGIGVDAPPLESLAVSDEERATIRSALEGGRVCFFPSRDEFLKWKGLREYV